MITTRVFLNALPSSAWKKNAKWGNINMDIGAFVEDALAIEQRIKKGVNQDNERARYTLCCNRLEASIKALSWVPVTNSESFRTALQNFQLPFISLSSRYIDLISMIYQRYPTQSSSIRLGTTFFPLEIIETHISAFNALINELGLADQVEIKQRIAFFKAALYFQCGVLEIQDPFYFTESSEGNDSSIGDLNRGKSERSIQQQIDSQEDESNIEENEYVSENEGRKAYDILVEQVEKAICLAKAGKNGAVNFSNQPHNIITEVLNEFVYSESGKVEIPVYINVIYTDGSQGKPFPLVCLPKRADDELNTIQQALPLKVALLSMRHLSMDQDVDMSWFRNREVSKTRAFGETDQFCYEHTKKLLEQSRLEGILKIHIYQTGLQPAIIGFYRAITEELLYRSNNSPSLEVTPQFYRGKSGYRQGRSWK